MKPGVLVLVRCEGWMPSGWPALSFGAEIIAGLGRSGWMDGSVRWTRQHVVF